MNKQAGYEKQYKESMHIPAPVEDVFAYIDDHSHFYSHVIKFSRAVGGRMELQFDEGHGKTVGSHIRLFGKLFGKNLSLEEVVIKRDPPYIKTWETVGIPKFLIVGQYRMNVTIEPKGDGSLLTVSLDYNTPPNSGLVKKLLSRVYGKLCAKEMVKGTRNYFRQT